MFIIHPSSRRLRWIVICGICFASLFSLACLTSCYSETKASKRLFNGSEAVPADAIVLFDGKDLSKWTNINRKDPATWKVENGYALVQGGDICTKQDFSDCQLHVEFWLPKVKTEGFEGANSGVFFNGAYEVQILDSNDEPQMRAHDCGAVYSVTSPIVNACRPPETWQSFDIIFRSPRMDKDGKKISNAKMTVFLNGVLVQDNSETPYPTRDHEAPDQVKGPIILQDHGQPLRYRNVWIRPL